MGQQPEILRVTSQSPEETYRQGVLLGQMARRGDVILLVGTLGTGKTCFTQGIAYGLGVTDYVTSSSFVLLAEYQGRLPLYHADLFRLDSLEEVAELGLDDVRYEGGVLVVEWAEKGLPVFPREHLQVHIEYLGENSRRLVFVPLGERYGEVVVALGKMLPEREGERRN